MKYLTCLPLVEADIPAVLALDQRCLGGLWTRSGYQRELESDCSDLLILVGASSPDVVNAHLVNDQGSIDIRSAENRTFATTSVTDDVTSSDVDSDKQALTLMGVGCLWAILEEAHITTLAIEPRYQRLKLGQLLLCHLLFGAQQRSLTRATLEVRESNEPALRLYQKFGFQSAGIRKRYYSDGENACILWRSGLQTLPSKRNFDQLLNESITQIENTKRYNFLRILYQKSAETA